MPNGGVMPSCFVCKWANKKLPPSEGSNPLLEPIECQQNGFEVWLPSSHVCSKLDDPYEGGGLSTFAASAGLKDGIVYGWLEIGYRTKEHPHIPQYHHELVELAPFREFSSWTLEQKQKAFGQTMNKKEQELLSQSNDHES